MDGTPEDANDNSRLQSSYVFLDRR